MTETTYDIIAKSLDRISMELHQADENNDFLRIGLLSGQLKAIKENLHRLLWIELPELNDRHKIEAVSKSTTRMFSTLVFLKWTLCDKHSLNAKPSTFLTTKQSNSRI